VRTPLYRARWDVGQVCSRPGQGCNPVQRVFRFSRTLSRLTCTRTVPGPPTMYPTSVIVGRLTWASRAFNWLIGERLAIVDSVAGVTAIA
jgi:hypothetical protein